MKKYSSECISKTTYIVQFSATLNIRAQDISFKIEEVHEGPSNSFSHVPNESFNYTADPMDVEYVLLEFEKNFGYRKTQKIK